MESGKKIEAIKLYRQQTGCGLKQRRMSWKRWPQSVGIVSKASGCTGVILAILLVCGSWAPASGSQWLDLPPIPAILIELAEGSA